VQNAVLAAVPADNGPFWSSNGPTLFDDITVMHTSGTSGEVGYFLYAPADYKRQRRAARANRQAFRSLLPRLGLRLSRIRVAFYGATGGHFFVPFSDLRRSTA
jgi:hypothetical protein